MKTLSLFIAVILIIGSAPVKGLTNGGGTKPVVQCVAGSGSCDCYALSCKASHKGLRTGCDKVCTACQAEWARFEAAFAPGLKPGDIANFCAKTNNGAAATTLVKSYGKFIKAGAGTLTVGDGSPATAPTTDGTVPPVAGTTGKKDEPHRAFCDSVAKPCGESEGKDEENCKKMCEKCGTFFGEYEAAQGLKAGEIEGHCAAMAAGASPDGPSGSHDPHRAFCDSVAKPCGESEGKDEENCRKMCTECGEFFPDYEAAQEMKPGEIGDHCAAMSMGARPDGDGTRGDRNPEDDKHRQFCDSVAKPCGESEGEDVENCSKMCMDCGMFFEDYERSQGMEPGEIGGHCAAMAAGGAFGSHKGSHEHGSPSGSPSGSHEGPSGPSKDVITIVEDGTLPPVDATKVDTTKPSALAKETTKLFSKLGLR